MVDEKEKKFGELVSAGREIAPNTGTNVTKFFTLATKSWKLVAKLATRTFHHNLTKRVYLERWQCKERFCLSLKMATNFFWIGYHFEEFRSQVAIRKKVNFTPCSGWSFVSCLLTELLVTRVLTAHDCTQLCTLNQWHNIFNLYIS